MSDEPTPELRDLAAKLFAAGRAERPAPALGRRLMLIEPPQAVPTAASAGRDAPLDVEGEPAAESARRQRPSRLAFWFAAAAVLAAGVSSWLGLEPDLAPMTISAERIPVEAQGRGGPRATSRERHEDLGDDADSREEAQADDAPVVQRSVSDSRVAEPIAAPSVAEPVDASRGVEPRARGKKERQTPRAPASSTGSASPPAVASRPFGTPSSAAERSAAAGESTTRAADAPLTLLEELDLIKRARGALRSGNPAHALELLERHAMSISGSWARQPNTLSGSRATQPVDARTSRGLAAEATLLRIEAYAALGRHDEASELAERFVHDNPSSALGDRAKSFIRSGPPVPRDPAPEARPRPPSRAP